MSQIQLPPGQQLAAAGKWPIVGESAPRRDDRPWTVEICGAVARQQTWMLSELQAMPQVEQQIDIHCVTRWSKPGVRFAGVPLATLLAEAEPNVSARFISFVARTQRVHSTSLVLHDALDLKSIVALTVDGAPLDEIRGGPVRVVVPGRYFYKSLKWLERIVLLSDDKLGFWEATAGYHNTADFWREERYIASTLNKAQARAILERRDIADLELLGLDAQQRDLTGLKAQGSVLRDADFRRCRLQGACFDKANLTNAHLQGADLRDASFKSAELAGADFSGADLRGACLLGASLFGTSFCEEADLTMVEHASGAIIDCHTRIERDALESLTPRQQVYLAEALKRVRDSR